MVVPLPSSFAMSGTRARSLALRACARQAERSSARVMLPQQIGQRESAAPDERGDLLLLDDVATDRIAELSPE